MADIELRRHKRFWFSDGSFHLLVEKTLYRVHRYLFEMHANKFPGITNASALSSQTPYILDDVKPVDLDRLLAYLYPCDLAVEEAKTSDEWISILTLASKCGFESLKAKAITKVADRASPIEKVVLGQQDDIPELLLPGYAALCQSNIPLSREEGARLGLDAVLNIYRMRQELWGTNIRPISADEALEKVKLCIAIPHSTVTQTTSLRQLSSPSCVPNSPVMRKPPTRISIITGKPPISDTIEMSPIPDLAAEPLISDAREESPIPDLAAEPLISDAREESDSGQSDLWAQTPIISATIAQPGQDELDFEPTTRPDFSDFSAQEQPLAASSTDAGELSGITKSSSGKGKKKKGKK